MNLLRKPPQRTALPGDLRIPGERTSQVDSTLEQLVAARSFWRGTMSRTIMSNATEGSGQPEPDVSVGTHVTVVVPACNEASVLPTCLKGLLKQDYPRQLHVIVVANGCSDATAIIAQSYVVRFGRVGHRLDGLELPSGGKPAALNAADALAGPGVRIYLDADVALSTNAISEVSRLLEPRVGVHVAVPRLRVAPAKSWITRCYGSVWAKIPYIRDDIVGCGFYAVSEAGRGRWTTFPSIISDDKFVRLHFERHERAVAARAYFQIQLPEGLGELIQVRGRWCRGNHELERTFPELARRDRGRYRQLLPFVLTHPTEWPRLPLFVAIYGLGELAAFWKRHVGLRQWERADNARRLLPRPLTPDWRSDGAPLAPN